MKADAVFEGGGVKGIGFVGAIAEIEKSGYVFENIVGTSAGAIVAALLAVGYNSEEIKEELQKLNYNRFKDKGRLDKLGSIGKIMSIIFEYGVYEGAFFEKWMSELLEKKGITKFGQIKTDYPEEKYRYKLQIVASDLTDRKILVLPRDLKEFGFDPDQFSIAKAVRMSMSIPIFFEPVKLEDINGKTHVIVDGGILSNYPVWILDDNTENPPWPTFGFKLLESAKRELKKGRKQSIQNPIDYLKAIVKTMIEAHDKMHISESSGDYDRTIGIPTTITIDSTEREIKTTDFNITQEELLLLYKNGEETAKNFIQEWDFEKWKEMYRQKR